MKKEEIAALADEVVERLSIAAQDFISPDTLLSEKQAATESGLNLSRLRYLRQIGGGPKFVKFGRNVFYARKDLAAWAASLPRHDSTSQYEETA